MSWETYLNENIFGLKNRITKSFEEKFNSEKKTKPFEPINFTFFKYFNGVKCLNCLLRVEAFLNILAYFLPTEPTLFKKLNRGRIA